MNKMTLSALIVAFWLSIAYSSSALAVDKCGDFTSKGNPAICCYGEGYNDANCVWWAWKKAKEQWKDLPDKPGKVGADQWDANKGENFISSDKPTLPSVLQIVNKKIKHVAWVEEIKKDVCMQKNKKGKCIKKETQIRVSEMNCYKPYQAQGSAIYKYPPASGTKYKFIYHK